MLGQKNPMKINKPSLLFALISVSFSVSAQLNKQAADEFIKRIVPTHAADFIVKEIPAENGKDVFEVQSKDGKIILSGNKGLSVASALGYYLKNYCNKDFGWNGSNMKLPARLPVLHKKIHHVTPYTYRYYLNYCTFNYSMSWWDWDRWQKEIDWMALNGINMPLALTGEEAIWRDVYKGMGFTNTDLDSFFSGPAYFSWLWMGNLDGWGGPLPQHWMDSHKELQKKILQRERSFGMTPVLPAFTGHVPPSFKDKFPQAKLKKTNWEQGFNDVYLLDAADPMFAAIGKKFIDVQTKEYGTDHLYSADTFNENTPPTNDSTFLSGVSKKIFQSMAAADPKAVWVMQGWLFYNNASFWQPKQIKALLNAVPDSQMIILDLFSEAHPVWNQTESFYGKPWIWNMLQNFGDNVGLYGRMSHVAADPTQALHNSKNMAGIGLAPEGIEQNPAVYELMLDNVWRNNAIDTKFWLKNYAERRYGKTDPRINEAWELLLNSVYNSVPRHGCPASIIVGRPSLKMGGDWRVDTVLNYNPKELVKAWQLFIKSAEALKNSDGFQYDLVDITRQVTANYANTIQPKIIKAYQLKDIAGFNRYSSEFLHLIDDMDELLGTRKDFLLGKWINEARANGVISKESDLYELNARDLITLWGDKESSLHEYSNRQWSGLVKGFYKPRWEMFFEAAQQSLIDNKPFDSTAFESKVKDFEWAWVNKHDKYAVEVKGNSVEVAEKMFKKYNDKIENAYL
jgi:alpha-N-acetylglucosaminidase